LHAFVGALPSNEYYADLHAALDAHQRQSMFNVIDLATVWKIDLIIRKSRAFSQEEFRRRQRVKLHDVSLFLATAEDAIISKLEWANLAQSRRQIEDVAAILRVRSDSLDHAYVEKWITELGLNEAWSEARLDGVDGDCLAQASLFSALSELVTTYGEDATAKYAEGLPARIRNGEFSIPLSRQ